MGENHLILVATARGTGELACLASIYGVMCVLHCNHDVIFLLDISCCVWCALFSWLDFYLYLFWFHFILSLRGAYVLALGFHVALLRLFGLREVFVDVFYGEEGP